MKPRSSYSSHTFKAHPEMVLLIDNDDPNCATVTNDAQNVVPDVLASRTLRQRDTTRIVYRDTMGRFDELRHDGRRFTGYAPLSAADKARFADPIRLFTRASETVGASPACSVS